MAGFVLTRRAVQAMGQRACESERPSPRCTEPKPDNCAEASDQGSLVGRAEYGGDAVDEPSLEPLDRPLALAYQPVVVADVLREP